MYEIASDPSNAMGNKDEGSVAGQIVGHDCGDPHERKARVGPFLQRRQSWQQQHDGSRQLSDAQQDTQLLGISHVPEVLDRLGGGGQIAERGEQRDGGHETRGSPVQDLPWRPAFLGERARRFRTNDIDESGNAA